MSNPAPTEAGLPAVEREALGRAAAVDTLPRAYGPPAARGIIRSDPGDFHVDERLPFEPTDAGEHLYLRVRKTGQNTPWVAGALARACGVRPAAVGYAGLKDRQAVTIQWFSVHLPGREAPSWPDIPGVEILEARRHAHKLRRGVLAGNRFRIVVRLLEVRDRVALDERLAHVASGGVPNYFGGQRFGHGGANLDLLAGPAGRRRAGRSFGLSALRSALFNGYLAGRVTDGSWNRALPGEIAGAPDSPGSGLLWGDGENRAEGEARRREDAWFEAFPAARALIARERPRMMRRALQVRPADFDWTLEPGRLTLGFELPRGAYATSLLREIVEFTEAGRAPAGATP